MAPPKTPKRPYKKRASTVANGRVGRPSNNAANKSAAAGDTVIVKQSLPSDTKIVEWRIQKFRQRLGATEDGDDVAEILLTAGESINMKTEWQICVQNDESKGFGIFMRLKEVARDADDQRKVYASFQMALVKPTGDICEATEFDMKEWNPSTRTEDFEGWEVFQTIDELVKHGIARSMEDPLRIQIKLVLYGHPKPKRSNDVIGVGNELGRIKQSWGDCLMSKFYEMSQDEIFTDVNLSVKPNLRGSEYVTVKAYKAILASGSPVFKRMFEEEGTTNINAAGAFVIHDMTEETLLMMLKFMYTGSIDQKWNSVALELLAAAEKYELTLLTKYIMKNVADKCTNDQDLMRLMKKAKEKKLLDVAKNIADKLKASADADRDRRLKEINDMLLSA